MRRSVAPPGAQGDPLRATVLRPPGAAQPRERRSAICDARPAGDARLVLHRDDRRRPWPVRSGRRCAGGRRRDGRRGLPGQGRCGRGAGSVALCPQLIELCRVIDTVLVDQEAVYAPRQGNDCLHCGLAIVGAVAPEPVGAERKAAIAAGIAALCDKFRLAAVHIADRQRATDRERPIPDCLREGLR